MKKKFLLIFLAIISIKFIIALFTKGIILFPDESCFFLKGEYFLNNFKINECKNLINFEAGNPFPAYSILISPIFLFFSNTAAFHAIQFINIILISSLIFPIFNLINPLIKNKKTTLLITSLILITPIISSYEKMILSESLFLFTIIWMTYFYQISFKKKSALIISILLGLIATLTRPFGFIGILAILISEFTKSKRKKIISIAFIPAIILLYIIVQNFLPHITTNIADKIKTLAHPESYLFIIKAIKNQTITLLFSTLFIPCLLFFSYFPKDKTKELKNIKTFIISFIILNLIISSQHIYQYFLNGYELDFLTRYINVSIILILSIGIAYIYKIKNLKINTLIFLIFTIPLFFINLEFSNHALNISISPYFTDFRGFIDKTLFFRIIFPITSFLLILLTIFNKKNLLKKSMIILIFTQFMIINIWQIQYTKKDYNSEIFNNLKDKNEKIILLESLKKQEKSKINYINFDYFRLITLSSNEIKVVTYNDLVNNIPDIKNTEFTNTIKEYEYLITPYNLDLNLITKDKKGYYLYNIKQNDR